MKPLSFFRGFFSPLRRAFLFRAPHATYDVISRDAAGRIIGAGRIHNAVVLAGLDKILSAVFKDGLSTPAWFVGLKGSGGVVPEDTMGAHGGWPELAGETYSDSTRPAFVPGAITAQTLDNAASLALYHTIAARNIAGLFLCDNATAGGSGGTLYSAGDFDAPVPVTIGGTFEALVSLGFEA